MDGSGSHTVSLINGERKPRQKFMKHISIPQSKLLIIEIISEKNFNRPMITRLISMSVLLEIYYSEETDQYLFDSSVIFSAERAVL